MTFESTRALASTIALLLITPFAAADDSPLTTPVEKLGDERYRIGAIVVDRNTSSFSLPGKIIHLTDALEYLAVSTEAAKEYESLLELTTSPGDFNLACILVGLDDEKSVKPRFQFDDEKAEGQSIGISLSWENDGETVTINGEKALTVGEEALDDNSWVYIGSTTGNYGKEFMADAGGTLIGFIHDPYSIIDHRNGVGIGNYGVVTGNKEILPPVGTAVSLTISVIQE